jgi:hypothetical protein
VVDVTLQAAADGVSPSQWMGLGFNDPALAAVRMVGSDAVVAGGCGWVVEGVYVAWGACPLVR